MLVHLSNEYMGWSCDIDRFGHLSTQEHLLAKIRELIAREYEKIHASLGDVGLVNGVGSETKGIFSMITNKCKTTENEVQN